MKLAITGHRPNKLGHDYELKSPLIKEIKKRILEVIDEHKPTHLISGMALGIDTLFAIIAHQEAIDLIAAIPCYMQERNWQQSSINLYRKILDTPINGHLPIQVIVTQSNYTPECMQDRNIWMVDNCDILLAVWDGTSGGTANCVKYAYSKERPVIRINPALIRL